MKHAILYGALLVSAASPLCSQPQIIGVVNSASFEAGLPSGGGLATVLCAMVDDVYQAMPQDTVTLFTVIGCIAQMTV